MDKGKNVQTELTKEELRRKIERVTREIQKVKEEGLKVDMTTAIYKAAVTTLDEDLASQIKRKKEVEMETESLRKRLNLLRLEIHEGKAREAKIDIETAVLLARSAALDEESATHSNLKGGKYLALLLNTSNKLESQKLERLEENNIMLMGSQKVGNRLEKYVGDHGSTCNSTAITQANHGSSPLIPTGFMIWSSTNVVLNVAGEDAHICVCCLKKPGLFTTICYVLEKHKIDIVSVRISSDQFRSMFMIQAHAKDGSGVAQFSEAFTVEDMYKQAANEIMLMTTPR
ncbi:uncharacterized protein LOC107026189 [Solanum pennellii]|uniref:Uncharacterized protein LOC107026189 n=1 Tax=Solanum pennellii TaxID=28526 RepID=A0ABM1V1Y3_SOLPN|nr:uncharacterized protein LOC107026189 [Solanum pennellii]